MSSRQRKETGGAAKNHVLFAQQCIKEKWRWALYNEKGEYGIACANRNYQSPSLLKCIAVHKKLVAHCNVSRVV